MLKHLWETTACEGEDANINLKLIREANLNRTGKTNRHDRYEYS